MQKEQFKFSPSVFAVLSRYPEWFARVVQAIDKPQLPSCYCADTIEIFDQYGVLMGRINGLFPYESTRTPEQKSEFYAWLLDGELAVLYIGSEVVVNRLQILAVAFGELL
jgi:hypothetical protein